MTPPPTLDYVTHDAFIADVEAVARGIEGSSWTPGFIVGIGRGGLAPAVYLSHRVGVPMLSVDHSSRVFGFADALLINLAGRAAGGEQLLFIDDINDSGGTIAYLRQAIGDHGGDLARLRFAVLIDNRRSGQRVDYRSREIDRAEDKRWFVFPWEALAKREALIEEAAAVPARLG